MPIVSSIGKSLAACTFLLLTTAAATGAAEKPNILVILTDDQGWGDLSVHGNQNLTTPNIDKLARDGAAFDRFFVCPVCSPTRAEFLTGRYHPRSGVYSTSAGGERMDLDEKTIADTFKAAGYATAAFGKWHNGMQYPYHPNGRGFDEYYGFCSGHWGDYYSPPLEHNGRLVRGNGFVIDDFTERAMQFIEDHRDGPFFVYLPYNTPHSPMQVPDRWWKKFENKELSMRHREPEKEKVQHTLAALAMCENIDWNVGRLMDKLDDLGIAGDTIVLYFCDNGPNGWRWNGGMKGRKGSTDEGGVRSPLFVRWAGRIEPGKQVHQISAAIDLLPTLADMAGIDLVGDKPLDGVSLKDILVGEETQIPGRKIVSYWRGRVSVRSRRYRLDNNNQLFDIIEDPGQAGNVAAGNEPTVEELKALADKFRADVLPGHDDDRRPFLIGHPDCKYTQVPARDGVAHGNIQRSNKFPNCSYFENWTSVDDKITWTAEVPADGKFRVELHYTCAAADAGSTVELSFNDARLVGRVTEPHDPPPRGYEHDLFPRAESPVKDFKAMDLGMIELQQGAGELTLKALDMPGNEVMDFRLLMLTRVE